jgi:SOS-response transcriptional repressor LexA
MKQGGEAMGRPKSKGPSIQLLRKKRRFTGKYIQDRRKELGINQDRVAEVLKYKDKQAVSNIERGVAPLPLNKIRKLAELLQVEPKSLAKLTLLDKEPELFRDIEFVYHNDSDILDEGEVKKGRKLMVPVLYSAHCSGWKDTTDIEYPRKSSNQYAIAETHDPDAFIAVADGESMIGSNIIPGDLLLVEPGHKIKNGDIVLVVSKKGFLVKKYVELGIQKILQPMNSSFDPIVLTDKEDYALFYIATLQRKINEAVL